MQVQQGELELSTGSHLWRPIKPVSCFSIDIGSLLKTQDPFLHFILNGRDKATNSPSRAGTFAGPRGQIGRLQSRKQHYVNRLLNIGEQA